MPSKNSVNNKNVFKDLEKKISPVLVVNNSSLKPYVELFDYSPENIYQQPLGSLVGFFEVKEYSDDSAYVVNFLTSVLKKEYYINPKRPVTESLDSALHKVNMALSELAKQGNIEWLGKLNAAICVLEKNNAHFSVAGKAKIFLYRNQGLTEISEDLASDSLEPHPLKTFVNVSSGRMEKEDRMLITAEDIFQILSANELKKNFQRFEGDKFVQFLKTALSNQMEMIASIVVEMSEVEIAIPAKAVIGKKTSRAANAFSEKTFTEPPVSTLTLKESLTLMDTSESDADYTDQKTGHIYVQGETSEPSENPKVALYWETTKEKVGEIWYLTKNETRRRFSLYKKQLARKMELRRIQKEKLAILKAEEKKREQEERVLQEIEQEEQLELAREAQKILDEQQKSAQQAAAVLETERLAEEQAQKILDNNQKLAWQTLQQADTIKEKLIENKKDEGIKINEIATQQNKHAGLSFKEQLAAIKQPEIQKELSFIEKLQRATKEQQRQSIIDLRATNNISETKLATIEEFEDETETESTVSLPVPIHQKSEIDKAKRDAWIKSYRLLMQKSLTKIKQISHKFIKSTKIALTKSGKTNKSNIGQQRKEEKHLAPHFSKIKKSFSFFTFKQKIYTLGALAIVFIVPLFIVHFLNKPKQPTITQLQEIPKTQAETLSNEKNINISAQKQSLLTHSGLGSTIITNVGIATFTKNSVVLIDGGQSKEYPIPINEGSIVRSTFMNDLSLVLILTDQNKVISFSPVSLKFIDNKINISGDASTNFIGTYLTYLYVLDPSTNQIYRYPRADGGFGEKTNWLKDNASLSSVSDLTIDDSVWVIQNNQIIKFFKGQSQPLSLENSHTPVHFDKLYTTINSASLWVLDMQNSRLLQYAKDSGTITAQYYNDTFKDGNSLSVDEKNKAAYITTSAGLISITLQ